jgi:hypothetical protein
VRERERGGGGLEGQERDRERKREGIDRRARYFKKGFFLYLHTCSVSLDFVKGCNLGSWSQVVNSLL